MAQENCIKTTLHKNWSFPLRISSVNAKKRLMKNFIFCAVRVKHATIQSEQSWNDFS